MNTFSLHRSFSLLAAVIAIATATTLGLGLTNVAADTSVKGAERLVRNGPPVSAPVLSPASAGDSKTAHCGGCATTLVKRSAETPKGGTALSGQGATTFSVPVHGCGSCATAIGVSGHGKAMTRTVSHECAKPALTAANCCK